LLIVIAAKDIGRRFSAIGLPLISGFIITGALAGPDVLGLLDSDTLPVLDFVDAFALPFIAFAAGAELHLDELRRRLRSILKILVGIITGVMLIGASTLFLLSDLVPFMQGKQLIELVAISLVGATILAAKSPSSAIAVIKELRARGPFTQTTLGVTVMMDAIVISIFAINSSIANVMLRGVGFNFGLLVSLFIELSANVAFGVVLGQILKGVYSLTLPERIKALLTLAIGYSVYSVSGFMPEMHWGPLEFRLLSEPLLYCLIAAVFVANYSRYGAEFEHVIEEISPIIFILFFTALGAGIDLDTLRVTWLIVAALVLARFVGMYVGAYVGGSIAGDPDLPRHLLGFAFITQAGVSLGLTKNVVSHFPEWGNEFATLFIAVIVVNTLIGPGFFKFALGKAGETHQRGDGTELEHGHRAIIFGVEYQSVHLARRLAEHNWDVTLADVEESRIQNLDETGLNARLISDFSVESLIELGVDKAGTIVAMLDSDTNYKICELAYENFGTQRMIARLHGGRTDLNQFKDLGVVVVDSGTAFVNLMEHYVRSPSAASILLGEGDKVVLQVRMGNIDLHGIALRDLHLPHDVLILAIRRGGQLLVTHGYNRLRLGDEISVVGSEDNLSEVERRFSAIDRD